MSTRRSAVSRAITSKRGLPAPWSCLKVRADERGRTVEHVGAQRLKRAAAAFAVCSVCAFGAAPAAAYRNPLLGGVADPGVLRTQSFDRSSTVYHVTSTSPAGPPALPTWSSPSNPTEFTSWPTRNFILRRLPAWIDRSPEALGIWAPQVYLFERLDRYIAYYSAERRGRLRRCIGRAVSARLAGAQNAPPNDFTDRGFRTRSGELEPLCHPDGEYSLIDPALFADPVTRRRYLLYKRDRNVGPKMCRPQRRKPKEIVIRRVDRDDGGSPLLTPRVLLTPRCGTWETFGEHANRKKASGRASVEAPTMVYNPATGYYYLFYSGNSYQRDRYGVGVARSRSPEGPFERHPSNRPILSAEADPAFCGAGHQDIIEPATPDKPWLMFYHAYRDPQPNRPRDTQVGETCQGGRWLMLDELQWRDGWPEVRGGVPSRE